MGKPRDLSNFGKGQIGMARAFLKLQVLLGVPGLQLLVPTKSGLRKDIL